MPYTFHLLQRSIYIRRYISTEIFTRYWWTQNTPIYDYLWSDQGEMDVIRSEHINSLGIKFLLGKNLHFRIYKQNAFLLKAYLGFGGRFKSYLYKNHSGMIGDVDVSNTTGRIQGFIPTLHLGIKLGLSTFCKR